MSVIEIEKVETQPENVIGFPQYLLRRLLEHGPALLEATMPTADAEYSEWHITPRRKTGPPPLVIRFHKHGLRPALARFGFLCGISPYSGHTLFRIKFADEAERRPEAFAIYLCNEPTMGFWIKVYLYGIDGAYPNYSGMYDAKPTDNPPPLADTQ